MSVETITLGCRLNFAESEAMRGARAGATRTGSSSTAARSPPRRCARPARRSAAPAASGPDARILVTGCAVQLEPRAFAAMPEVDRVGIQKFDARLRQVDVSR